MVRLSFLLARVPSIKFRKGGMDHANPGAAQGTAATAAGRAPTAATQAQPATSMSTLSDVDLPARYRRQPLSQEEIDHINGGGIV